MSDDDDFQNPSYPLPRLTQTTPSATNPSHSQKLSASSTSSSRSRPPLKPSNSQTLPRPSKRSKPSATAGKENLSLTPPPVHPIASAFAGSPSPFSSSNCSIGLGSSDLGIRGSIAEESCKVPIGPSPADECYVNLGKSDTLFGDFEDKVLPLSQSKFDRVFSSIAEESGSPGDHCAGKPDKDDQLFGKFGTGVYRSNFSIESRLIASGSRTDRHFSSSPGDASLDDEESEDFEPGTQLDALADLCCNEDVPTGIELQDINYEGGSGTATVNCPLCGIDISDLNNAQRQVHTNDCLDKEESSSVAVPDDRLYDQGPVVDGNSAQSSGQVVDAIPVVEWLRSLGLGKYEEIFIREEIDWDTLQWLTEEDLIGIGINALGPRKKILLALDEFRKGRFKPVDACDASEVKVDGTSKVVPSKLITDYFVGSVTSRNKHYVSPNVQRGKCQIDSGPKQPKNRIKNGRLRDIPLWCSIPGTPFRVDAFRYLRRDCSYWFLTHFHLDHYQGLTKSFCHGKIYCSLITARLVNMKIGVPWERLQVLPLNEKITVCGIDVTCVDANHCPGSIVILFEPPNGKAVLHTGDFRFTEAMTDAAPLQKCHIHTLILDTTYCNPQFDFPKQDAVIQFVIEAIQAESFNAKTLFLIGSYTIGKERLFLEVGRTLRQKIFVTAAKMRLLECLDLPQEDLQWLTLDEQKSHIHVVPIWTLASFKRLKHIANQYMARFSLIVAFSPTGWTFGKGKKKSPGRRSQQGTIIRYEVPYSEHCSFSELKDFVKFISPANIIPSVNEGPESSNAMVALLS